MHMHARKGKTTFHYCGLKKQHLMPGKIRRRVKNEYFVSKISLIWLLFEDRKIYFGIRNKY